MHLSKTLRGMDTACALATGSASSYWCYHWQLVLSLVVPRVAGRLAASLAREAGNQLLRGLLVPGYDTVATHACSCAACDVRRDVRAPSDGETERCQINLKSVPNPNPK